MRYFNNIITGQQLDENEFLWDYLKRKLVQSKYIMKVFLMIWVI